MKTISSTTSFLVVLTLRAASCLAQGTPEPGWSTDRPSVGTGPDVTAASAVVIENGFGFVRGSGTSTMDGIETYARFGVGKGVEVHALLPNSQRSWSTPGMHWQDAGIGTKIALPSLSDWHFATGTNVSIPTGSPEMSSGGWDPSLLFAVSHPVNKRVSGSASAVVGWYSNDTGTRERDVQFAFDAGWTATKSVSPFVEWAPAISSTSGNSSYVAQTGATWLVRPRLQLDARAGALVKDSGTAFVGGLGFSVFLAKPWFPGTGSGSTR